MGKGLEDSIVQSSFSAFEKRDSPICSPTPRHSLILPCSSTEKLEQSDPSLFYTNFFTENP